MPHARGRDPHRRAQRRDRRRHDGLLVDDDKASRSAIDRVLGDDAFRTLLAKNALEHASQFTWAATARGTLEVLAAEALRRKSA